jgi:hypothetical protein
MKNLNKIGIGIIFILLTYQASSQMLEPGGKATINGGAGLLGEIISKGTVEIRMKDGSVVTLNNGDKGMLFANSEIYTREGQAILKVKDGKYIVEPNSRFHVVQLGDGWTGLIAANGEGGGEACYCFNPHNLSPSDLFSIKSIQADTLPYNKVAANYPEGEIEGRVKVMNDSTTYTYALKDKSVFKTDKSVEVLDPGKATSNPKANNPYDVFDGRKGCCGVAILPILLPAGAAAAVGAGAAIGIIEGEGGGGEASPFTPIKGQ